MKYSAECIRSKSQSLSRMEVAMQSIRLTLGQAQKRMEEEMWELLEEERKKEEAREKERTIQKVLSDHASLTSECHV